TSSICVPSTPIVTRGKTLLIHMLFLCGHRSVNEVICHGIPDARKLEDSDIVNVDVSVDSKGCHGDLNETFFLGNVDEASQQLVRCTYECLKKSYSDRNLA
ncbi:hypothetical protein MKW98_004886, partial [Papaver atlanticum]